MSIEQILNEEKCFQSSMGQCDRQSISLSEIEFNPRWRFDAPIFYQRAYTQIGRLQLRGQAFGPTHDDRAIGQQLRGQRNGIGIAKLSLRIGHTPVDIDRTNYL